MLEKLQAVENICSCCLLPRTHIKWVPRCLLMQEEGPRASRSLSKKSEGRRVFEQEKKGFVARQRGEYHYRLCTKKVRIWESTTSRMWRGWDVIIFSICNCNVSHILIIVIHIIIFN